MSFAESLVRPMHGPGGSLPSLASRASQASRVIDCAADLASPLCRLAFAEWKLLPAEETQFPTTCRCYSACQSRQFWPPPGPSRARGFLLGAWVGASRRVALGPVRPLSTFQSLR